MSNYLSHLVAKTLNQVETVQPRFISRFEPQSGVGNPLTGFVTEKVELPRDRASNHPAVAQSVVKGESSQPDRSSRLSEVHNGPAAEPQRQNERLSTPPYDLNQVQPALLSSQTAPHSPPPVSPRSASSDGFPVAAQLSLIPESDHNLHAATLPNTRFNLQPDSRQDVAQSHSNLISQAHSTQRPKSAPSPRALSPIPDAHQNLTNPPERNTHTPSQKPLQPQSLISNLPTPKPPTPAESVSTIQVSIGRIEVRATPSKLATPKPRPASPTLSLSDYLDQRAKRER